MQLSSASAEYSSLGDSLKVSSILDLDMSENIKKLLKISTTEFITFLKTNVNIALDTK